MTLIDNILAGISLVASVESFLVPFIDVVVGTIAGAMPGMSATMAVALTRPFAFAMALLHNPDRGRFTLGIHAVRRAT